MIRDQALAVSGLLVERARRPVGASRISRPGCGRSWPAATTYDQDHGDDLYRRSLYTFWKRTVAAAVDGRPSTPPGRETCTVRETRTNTPLQALDAAERRRPSSKPPACLAERMHDAKAARRPRSGSRSAFRLATAPRPDAGGAGDPARRLRATSWRSFRADPRRGRELLARRRIAAATRGSIPPNSPPTPRSASVILNLDETITKE